MKPATGYGYLEVAAHIAAESSTGTNVEVSTTDDFTKGVDALVYFIDEAKGVMKVAYPNDLFDRNVTDGRAMLVSFLTLAIGNNQGMGDVKHLQMQDFYVPWSMLRHVRRPGQGHHRPVGHPRPSARRTAATSPAPSSSPSWVCVPSRSPQAAYQFWLGGDFIKNDEPQGNQVFCPTEESASRWCMTR